MNHFLKVIFLLILVPKLTMGQADDYLKKYDIEFNISKLKDLKYGKDSLDNKKVLFNLFPGLSDKDFLEDDAGTVSMWRCPSCKKLFFENEESTDTLQLNDTLPYNLNFTKITNEKYYKNIFGVQKCLVSFSTSNNWPPSGRYNYGLLSLAVFSKDKDWKLEAFNPFVNYQGGYSTSKYIDSIVKINEIEFGIAKGGNGYPLCIEDYCPYYSDFFLVNLTNCREALKIKDTYCSNTGSDLGSKWDTEYNFTKNGDSLQVITRGVIEKSNYWGISRISELSFESIKGLSDKFHFEIKRIYISKENIYKLEYLKVLTF